MGKALACWEAPPALTTADPGEPAWIDSLRRHWLAARVNERRMAIEHLRLCLSYRLVDTASNALVRAIEALAYSRQQLAGLFIHFGVRSDIGSLKIVASALLQQIDLFCPIPPEVIPCQP